MIVRPRRNTEEPSFRRRRRAPPPDGCDRNLVRTKEKCPVSTSGSLTRDHLLGSPHETSTPLTETSSVAPRRRSAPPFASNVQKDDSQTQTQATRGSECSEGALPPPQSQKGLRSWERGGWALPEPPVSTVLRSSALPERHILGNVRDQDYGRRDGDRAEAGAIWAC